MLHNKNSPIKTYLAWLKHNTAPSYETLNKRWQIVFLGVNVSQFPLQWVIFYIVEYFPDKHSNRACGAYDVCQGVVAWRNQHLLSVRLSTAPNYASPAVASSVSIKFSTRYLYWKLTYEFNYDLTDQQNMCFSRCSSRILYDL
jgi:outer membrane protein assembly factor BamB